MKTAIVILNWNGLHFLQAYLPVLCKNTPQTDAAVIIADNGSTDGSVAWLKENFPELKLISFDRNYGFTGGYNRALEHIEAEYFILLNSDIKVPEKTENITGKDRSNFNWLQPLIDFMDSTPQAGICQPKILSEQYPSRFEYAGACGGFIDKYGFPFCRGRILSCIEQDKGQYDNPIQIFWASGACMMIRSSLWHKLGGLDDSFFAHMEEIDLCWRAKLLGYQVWAVPQSRVYHVGGGALPNNSPRKLYLNYRNNLLMLYKNLPPDNKRNILIFKRMCIDGLSSAIYILQGKTGYFKAVLKAHKDFRKMMKSSTVTLLQPLYKERITSGAGYAALHSDALRALPGFYPKSIILKFFTGKKRFSQI